LDINNGKYTIKNKKILQTLLNGYVSFSPGAPKIAFPEEHFKVIKCTMSNFQYKCYKMVEEREGHPDFTDMLKLSNAFFVGTRMISNVSFPNKKAGEKGFESLIGCKLSLSNIKKYATKFDKIMKKIKSNPGPAIVYSNFREYGGIEPFIQMLTYNGYCNIFADDSSNSQYNKKRFGIWSGSEKMELKEITRNIYNQKDNTDGSLIKIMIISPSGKEGLSLFRTRSLHIMEPYFNWSRIAQIIGRGSRFCSHKDLPLDDRTINIYMYLAVSPYDDKTVDEYIYEIMCAKKELLQEFYEVLENAAVDKLLFSNSKKFV
jgi:hypothetical protein